MTSYNIWEKHVNNFPHCVQQSPSSCLTSLRCDMQYQWSTPELCTPTIPFGAGNNMYRNDKFHCSEVSLDHQATSDSTSYKMKNFENTSKDNDQATTFDDLSDESIIRLLESFELDHSYETLQDAKYQSCSVNTKNLTFYNIGNCFYNPEPATGKITFEQIQGHRTMNIPPDLVTRHTNLSLATADDGISRNNLEQSLLTTRMKITQSERGKRQRSIYLWEFLAQLLSDSRFTNCIRWISQLEGIFCMVDSAAVAKMWGRRKKRQNMTYEKMSRAMRYYYKRNILERVPKQKLIYKFGIKALKEINSGNQFHSFL